MGYVLQEGPQKATVDHITLDVEGTAVPAYHARPETSVRTSADPIAHPDAQSVRDACSRRGLPEGVSR